MKLVRHHEQVIAIFERAWEKAYLLAHQGKEEWVPLYLSGQAQPQLCAEIHTITRTVRLHGEHLVPSELSVQFCEREGSGLAGIVRTENTRSSRG